MIRALTSGVMIVLALSSVMAQSPAAQGAALTQGQPVNAPASQPAAGGASNGSPVPQVPATSGQASKISDTGVASQGFSYDADGRRDPFVNLLRRGTDMAQTASARPPGLAGLGAAEVTLKGTVRSRDGFVAMLQGIDAKTYIVRPGDKLYDGTIRAITDTALVILQQVNDPLSLDKAREVRKTIRQTDEAK